MTHDGHDTPTPAELRGRPRSSYARSHAPLEEPMGIPHSIDALLVRSLLGDDGCCEWQGALNAGGYGVITDQGHTIAAHRLAWALDRGEDVPAGMMVCHTCDNRSCVNPAHLYVGTAYDNNRDTVERDRIGKRGGNRVPR